MLRGIVGILLLALISSCAAEVRPASQELSLINIRQDQVLLVGKIELHPPLRGDEQVLKTYRGEGLKNNFILYCGNRFRELKESISPDFNGTFDTTLEQEFFIKIKKDKTAYVSGGFFYTVYDPPANVKLSPLFNSPLQIALKPDDEAVYIGTIQYNRDKDNHLTSVTIRDDFKKADARFKMHFGTAKTLRKALATPQLL